MGVTIKKEMTTDKFREGTQMSTKITKEATGMDLITPISGAAKSRTGPNREESTPKAVPARQASKKPKVMRQKENRMALQKSQWGMSSKSRSRTETGDTKRISCPNAMAPSCQTMSHTATAHSRTPRRLFCFCPLAKVVEIIAG